MAFPGTYNINYYKGDTYEFRIYPKKPDGLPYPLASYVYDDDDNSGTPDFDSAIFAFAETRGGQAAPGYHRCFAKISDEGDYILCTIRPEDAAYLDASKDYVYDVQVSKNPPGSDYPYVLTLLTGTITIQDQVVSSTNLGA